MKLINTYDETGQLIHFDIFSRRLSLWCGKQTAPFLLWHMVLFRFFH